MVSCRNLIKKPTKQFCPNVLCTSGKSPPEPIVKKFCTGVGTQYTINYANFGVDRLMGFGTVVGQFFGVPLTCTVGLAAVSYYYACV